MKHNHIIFSALALICLMIGCQNSELDNQTDDPNLSQNLTIGFNPDIQTTKAQITEMSDLQSDGFNVSAFLEDNNNTYYFTTDVKYNNTDWKCDNTQYWPVAALTFYGYSPLAEDHSNNIVINNGTDISDYSLTYTCPADVDDQLDLLVSKSIGNSKPSDGSSVNLGLKHALSGIKFQVKFEDEKNVTLNSITINYVNIEKQRTYNFAQEKWLEPTSDKICFEGDTELTTAITPLDANKTQTTTDPGTDPIIFTADKIGNQLMIIPQLISVDESSPQYISIKISYSIVSADDTVVPVETGVMQLPAPTVRSVAQDSYLKGEIYTYNIVINGQKIIFSDVDIEDQDDPLAAYGNIDLGLITVASAMPDGLTPTNDVDDVNKETMYYTTALRVQKLLEDDVNDFVVVGDLEAGKSSDSYQGNGKLGYYGGWSSPFNLGVLLASADSYSFSVDLRGTYGYPEFQYAKQEESNGSSDIQPTDEILMPGLFYGVNELNEVILPHGIKAIGDHAFADCDGLTTIDIADVLHIENGAFQNASALTEVIGDKLTRIHKNAFDECRSLHTINLSNVTEVDEYGFVECESLTNVDLSKLSVIDKHAFDGCIALTLADNTELQPFTTVADYAFSQCSQLGANGAKIDLTNATLVGEHAFHTCTKINLTDGNLDDLTTIGDYAFADCEHIGTSLTVSLPAIETIGVAAFANCTALNIVSGLDCLTKIETSTFQKCINLKGADSKIALTAAESVGDLAFNGSGVVEVKFSDKLESVGDYAFNNCLSLTTLTGLDNVTSVGVMAFASSTQLESLSLPSLVDGGWGAEFFANCTSLKDVSIPKITVSEISYTTDDEESKTSNVLKSLEPAQSLESVNFESLIAEITSEAAFQGKTSLESVNFAAATSVGNNVFSGCSSLSNVTLSSATSIGSAAFENCTSLQNISLPAALTLGDNAFKGCTLLESVYLPLVNSVGSNPFRNCTSLETISLPSVTGAFGIYGYFMLFDASNNFSPNTTLKSVSLPKVTSVEAQTFANCSALETVDLSLAETIGGYAFENCTSLAVVDLPAATSVPTNAFDDCTELEKLLLPAVSGSFGGWQCFNTLTNLKYIDLSSVTELAAMTFQENTSVVSIDLRSAISIGKMAFQECTALEKLNLSSFANMLPNEDGTMPDIASLFWNMTSDQCEIWLSDDMAATISTETPNFWAGQTWKAIHKASDGKEFTLE